MKLSLVISTLDRAELLERTLFATCQWQSYQPEDVELVLVVDDTKQWAEYVRVMQEFCQYFYKSTLIEIDSHRLSNIPVSRMGNPALGVNVAVKAAENEIILKTDAECLPLSETIQGAMDVFDPLSIWFFSVRMLTAKETEVFALDALKRTHPLVLYERLIQVDDLWHISERRHLPYWFGAVFSRSLFLNTGGIDEEFLRGYAGEDDEWAERMVRNGVEWRWSDKFQILHQHHGARPFVNSVEHEMNIARLKRSRELMTYFANQDYDWGSDAVITRRHVFHAIDCTKQTA